MKQRSNIVVLSSLAAVAVLALCVMIGWRECGDVQRIDNTRATDRLLLSPPQNRNLSQIRAVQQALAGRDRFSFVVLGDSQANYQGLARIVREALRLKPDFMIHTGDFTHHGTYAEYRKMTALMDRIDTPLIVIPGNHDIKNQGMRCFAHLFGPPDFCFDVGKYRFICLNNNNSGVDQQIYSPGQTPRGIGADLAADGFNRSEIGAVAQLLQGWEHAFIFMHQPPPIGPFRVRAFTRNAKPFMDMLEDNAHRIHYVFSGHIHTYAEQTRGGVCYVVSGGAGGELHPPAEGFIARHNYVLVTVTGDKVVKSLHVVDPQGGP